MRAASARDGLSVQAIAGTHTVLLGVDLADPVGCLRIGIHRSDHTEGEAYWLRGMKTFAWLVPHPAPGMDFSQRGHPVQGSSGATAPPDPHSFMVHSWGGRAWLSTPDGVVRSAFNLVMAAFTQPGASSQG